MTLFGALFITKDLSMKRLYTDNECVLSFLKENKDAKVYRISNEQIAIISVDSNDKETILWEDVPLVRIS